MFVVTRIQDGHMEWLTKFEEKPTPLGWWTSDKTRALKFPRSVAREIAPMIGAEYGPDNTGAGDEVLHDGPVHVRRVTAGHGSSALEVSVSWQWEDEAKVKEGEQLDVLVVRRRP